MDGRKESGFENLKTRFQDGMKAILQPNKKTINPQRKQALFVERLKAKKASRNESKQENDVEILPACHTERKLIIHLYGWQSIMMYHNKEVLQ